MRVIKRGWEFISEGILSLISPEIFARRAIDQVDDFIDML